MARFEWTDDLSAGNVMIDSDHKHLIGLVNKLDEAMRSGMGNTILGGILTELIDYTVSHFSREERLMQHINYADYAMHKQEHERLIKDVSELKRTFDAGAMTLSSKTYMFLCDWLTKHIKVCDKALGQAAK